MTDLGKQYKNNPPVCPVCGKQMYEVLDTINNKYTGLNWRCDCMPKGMVMSYL